MVYLYLAWMEWFSVTLADVWHIERTDRSFERDDLFAEVHPSLPVLVTAPEIIPREDSFSLYGFFCGVGIVPGL